MLLSLAPMSRGQGSSTAAEVAARQEAEENYKTLSARVDDMVARQDALDKKLQAMSKEITELREQSSKPAGNYASQDDLKRLADAIQEIDKKREADKELILHEISKLGKTISTTSSRPNRTPPPSDVVDNGTSVHGGSKTGGGSDTAANPNQDGYNYEIKKGDTFSVIALAYRKQGINVTSDQIEKANPGVNPSKLKIGQKIFIPAPPGTK